MAFANDSCLCPAAQGWPQRREPLPQLLHTLTRLPQWACACRVTSWLRIDKWSLTLSIGLSTIARSQLPRLALCRAGMQAICARTGLRTLAPASLTLAAQFIRPLLTTYKWAKAPRFVSKRPSPSIGRLIGTALYQMRPISSNRSVAWMESLTRLLANPLDWYLRCFQLLYSYQSIFELASLS